MEQEGTALLDARDETAIQRINLVKAIAGRLGAMPGVTAVALGGSSASGIADSCSDVDLYVYAPEPPPLALRRELAMEGDPSPELDNQAFGPGDE